MTEPLHPRPNPQEHLRSLARMTPDETWAILCELPVRRKERLEQRLRARFPRCSEAGIVGLILELSQRDSEREAPIAVRLPRRHACPGLPHES